MPSAEELTARLTVLSTQLSTASPAERPRIEKALAEVATVRRTLLEALIRDEPEAVVRAALSTTERTRLPQAIRRDVESAVQEEGELEVLIEDRFSGSETHHQLRTDRGERFSLHFAGSAPHLQTGTRVRVSGVRVGQAIAVAAPEASQSFQALSAVAPNTFGEQRTLVMLVNFQDNPAQPYTPDYARHVVFSDVTGFDWENSYHQTWLSGDVAGWFTIPLNSTVCDTSALSSYANAAAAAAGFNLSAYTRYVYGFPDNLCGFWGLGSVGGNPSVAWINGDFTLRVVAHEMGHNFGLYHSHSFDCGAAVIGSSCTTDEYGDTVDIMGASTSGHFNAFQKERLGWLDYAGSPPLVTVTANGSYWLEPYETSSSNSKALKILKSTDPATGARTWYYVEYRQAIGTDAMFAGNSNILNGIILHTGSESTGNSSNLLDMTAGTSSWSDPALSVGLLYADAAAQVTIKSVSSSSTGTMVSVSISAPPPTPTRTLTPTPTRILTPTPTRTRTLTPKPTPTASPAGSRNASFVTQSVPTQMVTGGSYQVSVTFRNTGTNTWTAASNYRLGSQNPQDNAVWGMGRVGLNAGESIALGQQKTFTWNVTAPAVAGSYKFQWRMLQEGVTWFGGFSSNVAVTLTVPPARDAVFVAQSVPTTMLAGQAYTVSVTMRNTGSQTWTAASGYYRLGSQNPQDNLAWGRARVDLGASDSITTGQQKTFSFTVTAPATAGTYNFQWRMLQEGVVWFGALTSNVAVTVTK